MRNKKYNPKTGCSGKSVIYRQMLVICLLIGAVIVSGCANNYGRVVRSSEVTAAFEQGQAVGSYNYYYSGREGSPYALIGIDKAYKVPSKLWQPFVPSTEVLQRKATFIYKNYDEAPYGAEIIDPDGQRIGVWYSRVLAVHSEIDTEAKTVSVLYRDPEMGGGGRVYP
jgi:hypothetical protein